MKYKGSKARIANEIKEVILKDRAPGEAVIEPFGGGANFTSSIDGERVCSDVNKYVISCLDALSKGWIPPKDITRGFYNECRAKYNKGDCLASELKIIGYVGINGSYGGRFYDGGYAGITTTRNGSERNYPREAFNNVMKQVEKLKGVIFIACDYRSLQILDKSIIYCDPPYYGTKEYIEAKKSGFSTCEFFQWCRDRASEGHKVFVSEYAAPDDFACVWEKEVKSSLSANGKTGGSKSSVERLFVYKPPEI